MGNLPMDRVQPARPFINAGVDFAGPVWTHYRIRGKKPTKSYIAVYCCFATRAIHLELVTDLTTDAFIGSLRRFVSRRGNCLKLYCDNGTNFVGAANQLDELYRHLSEHQSKIEQHCTDKGIEFHFIPPRTPHFGGLWEAAVKSVKLLLFKTIGNASLTFEELETLLTEIEAILNSRPLTPLSANPNDLTAITPGHFLIGEPTTTIRDPLAQSEKHTLLRRWNLVSHLKCEFWQRWTKEYLSELQQRTKWKQPIENVKSGTMVVLKEDNLPPTQWRLGRITKVISGKDGFIRVVDVLTKKGVLRRDIRSLCPLPVESSEPEIDRPSSNPVPSSNPESVIASTSVDDNSLSPDESPRRNRNANQGNEHSARSSPLSMLMLSLSMLSLLGDCHTQFTNRPFQHHPGVYFEDQGQARLIGSHWSLITYFDLTSYQHQMTSDDETRTRDLHFR